MTFSSGVRLGPYEIQSFLSRGGMGEVYRAKDTRLNRPVVIKVLPKEACSDANRLSRFEGEARSASALNHPNIVTIYDIGTHEATPFIAMEFVEGQTLRQMLSTGPLPSKTLIDFAAQLSNGLARAHEAGIVHRDLKPENVIVNKDGLVKILDFGLAKLCEPSIADGGASQVATAGPSTSTGLIVGTVGYMSPEQASGKSVDYRSDQFSFGTMLYEMATGRSPFHRQTAAETLTAIIREDPEPLELLKPDLPAPFIWLVRRCLSKDPAGRYTSTRDLAQDLRDLKDHLAFTSSRASLVAPPRASAQVVQYAIVVAVFLAMLIGSFWFARSRQGVTSKETALIPSIAVLPFSTFGNQAEEYFSDGMTEALITELAKIPGMKVIARNSVFQYKGKNVNIPQVGKELSVNYVLEGSVQRTPDRMRIHAQLINVKTGYHLWAERYDRTTADVFAVQDDISTKIASALRLTLSKGTPTQRTKNLQAYDYYLQGKYFLNMRYDSDLDRAIPLLEKAIALDPEFALAHAALGKAYRSKFFFVEPRKEWEEKAFVEIEKALALDPNLAEAYAGRGRLRWTRQNNFPHAQAAADYKKAIELDPNLAEAHTYLCGVYTHVGLLEEAAVECKEAVHLDPSNAISRGNQIMYHFFKQDFQRSLSEAENSPGDEIWKALALIYLNRNAEAEKVIKSLLEELSRPQHQAVLTVWDASFIHSGYAVLLAKLGNAAGAEEQIRLTIEKDRGLGHFHHSEYNIASAYALMGKTDLAIDWLQKTADHGFACYPLFANDPHLKSLRGTPRFVTFLEELKQQMEDYRAQFFPT